MIVMRTLVTIAVLLTAVPGLAQPAATPASVTGWQVVSVVDTFAPSYQKVVVAQCPQGKHVLGGGYFPKDYQGELGILGSWPSDRTGSGMTTEGSSWAVYAHNLSGVDSPSIVVYAICGSVSP
jgi:hypothetical protein